MLADALYKVGGVFEYVSASWICASVEEVECKCRNNVSAILYSIYIFVDFKLAFCVFICFVQCICVLHSSAVCESMQSACAVCVRSD